MALSRRSKNGLSWRGMTCALFACTAFTFAALTVAAQDQPATQTPAMQAPAPASAAQMSQPGGGRKIFTSLSGTRCSFARRAASSAFSPAIPRSSSRSLPRLRNW